MKLKEKIKENKQFLIGVIIVGIIFFSYRIVLSWDSSEYLGMASFIGTSEMFENWLGHRGIVFPLILRLSQLFGIQNKWTMLITMYIFFLIMLVSIYNMYKENKDEIGNPKWYSTVFTVGMTIFVTFNPLIFGYAHVVLTEFVSIPVTVLSCYVAWKWIYTTRKKMYVLVFATLTIFLYHTKQVYVTVPLFGIAFSALMAFAKNPTKKEFLYRLGSLAIVLIFLFVSVELWEFVMKDVDVVEKTLESRVNSRLVYGISKSFTEVGRLSTIDEIDISKINISAEEKQEIEKIVEEESDYTDFVIYENSKGKCFVYFKTNGNMKEQIAYYLKILTKSPVDIIKSYKIGYTQLIFSNKIQYTTLYQKYSLFYENSNFSTRVILPYESNIVDVNSDYEEFVKNYESGSGYTKYTNLNLVIIEIGYINMINIITKISIYYLLPIFTVVCTITYLLIKGKKKEPTNLKMFELIITLYGVAFGYIMGVVIFGATIDRYIMPSIAPMHIANVFLVILVIRTISDKVRKKQLMLDSKTKVTENA